MRFSSLIFSAFFATAALAGNLSLDTSSCKVQNQVVKGVKDTKQVFSCLCNGGSGDYDWHFTQLPEGWRAEKDKIFSGDGKFENKKIYGTKVEIFDKKNNDSVKRSLFFTFNEGKVHRVVDNDFQFDVASVVSKIKDRSPIIGGIAGVQAKVDLNRQRFEKIFDGSQGVGGGCKLGRLRPFIVRSGLYQGDDKNPFKDKLPNDDEVEKIVEKGDSKQVRDVVVNVVRSKVPCRDISVFLQKTLQRLRKKIGKAKDEFEESKKSLIIIQEKIKFLSSQLNEAQKNKTTNEAQLAEVQKLRAEGKQISEERKKIEQSSKSLDKQHSELEKVLGSLVVENKKVQEKENWRLKQVNQLNTAIQELQQKIKTIKEQKEAIIKAGQEDRKLISQNQASIASTKQKLGVLKTTIEENQAKCKTLSIQLTSIQGKIIEIEKLLKKSNNKDKAQDLKSQIKQLQSKLDERSRKIKEIEPIFKSLSKDYDDFSKVSDSNFNVCFKNLFKEDNIDFKEIDDDRVEFKKGDFIRYTKKLFGNASNIRQNNKPEDKQKEVSENTKENSQKVEIRRSHLFSKDWSRAHGNPLDDDKGQDGGKKFDQDDFQCDSRNQLNLKSFKGKIVSIKKNVITVQNQSNQECKLFLGGCSRIQTVNKKLPFVGGQAFWRGTERSGKVRQFNAHHLLCN